MEIKLVWPQLLNNHLRVAQNLHFQPTFEVNITKILAIMCRPRIRLVSHTMITRYPEVQGCMRQVCIIVLVEKTTKKISEMKKKLTDEANWSPKYGNRVNKIKKIRHLRKNYSFFFAFFLIENKIVRLSFLVKKKTDRKKD